MASDSERGEAGVKSVQLAFDVLEAIAAAEGEVGVSELALALGTTKGTIFRHLQTLVDRGYCQQNAATSRYKLGLRAHILGRSATGQLNLLSACEVPARDLREELGETVVISGGVGPSLVVLSTTLGKSPLEIGVRAGSELVLHATAQGKVTLAFGSAQIVQAFDRRKLDILTEHTISSRDALARELDRVRERGYAVAPNEDTLGINALAAPVLDETGTAIGSIAIVGSIQYIKAEPDKVQVDAVLRAAIKASWNLGYKGSIIPLRRPA